MSVTADPGVRAWPRAAALACLVHGLLLRGRTLWLWDGLAGEFGSSWGDARVLPSVLLGALFAIAGTAVVLTSPRRPVLVGMGLVLALLGACSGVAFEAWELTHTGTHPWQHTRLDYVATALDGGAADIGCGLVAGAALVRARAGATTAPSASNTTALVWALAAGLLALGTAGSMLAADALVTVAFPIASQNVVWGWWVRVGLTLAVAALGVGLVGGARATRVVRFALLLGLVGFGVVWVGDEFVDWQHSGLFAQAAWHALRGSHPAIVWMAVAVVALVTTLRDHRERD